MAELRASTQHVEAERTHLSHIFNLLHALGGQTSPVGHLEEELFRIREGYHQFRLDPVEADHPKTNFRSAPPASDLELVYFSKELQRTQLVGHFRHQGYEIPVHYGLTGAIILKRTDKRFGAWHQPKLENFVLLPFEFSDAAVRAQFEGIPGLRILDSGGTRPEYTQLRIDAVRKAHALTQQLRGELLHEWRTLEGADNTQVLVASGIDVDTPNSALTPNFVALSEQVYVPWQNSQVLERQLQIGEHERGQVLKATKVEGDPMTKYTWFIRLRLSAKADPEFGLLRCTIIAKDDADAIERANRFSTCVMAERLPVTFPAEGWDKLIFPVKLCRDYLESLIPTKETVRSYFGRD
jgi:hypothetical protein